MNKTYNHTDAKCSKLQFDIAFIKKKGQFGKKVEWSCSIVWIKSCQPDIKMSHCSTTGIHLGSRTERIPHVNLYGTSFLCGYSHIWSLSPGRAL